VAAAAAAKRDKKAEKQNAEQKINKQ